MTAPPAIPPSIPPLLSAPRLGTYLAACGNDPDQGMRLYSWNIEVSAAMWGGLSVLEVCLRNAINQRLESMTGQPDWWNANGLRLHFEQEDAIRQALRAARQTKAPLGQVVSNLMLGFWTSLLANRYHQRLWVPALQGAFPRLGGRRSDLQSRLERLRRLRNRIAHHEPVFNRALASDHDDVLMVLDAIDTDLRNWVAANSRVPDVLAARTATVTGARLARF
jgi:hypothetical protein